VKIYLFKVFITIEKEFFTTQPSETHDVVGECDPKEANVMNCDEIFNALMEKLFAILCRPGSGSGKCFAKRLKTLRHFPPIKSENMS
jgi:hypothetical protein